MNPEGMERPLDKEPLLEERQAIQDELIADNSGGTLSDEAYAAKQARLKEIEEILESQ